MTCPRCGSRSIWDDNLWYGCNACGYAAGPDGGTMLFAKRKPGLADNLKDIPGSNLPAPIYLVREDDDGD